MHGYRTGLIVVLPLVIGLAATASTAAESRQTEKVFTLFASGDTNLGRWVPHSVYTRGPDWPLEETHHLSKSADIALTNLECAVATSGFFNDKGERRPHLYRGRPEMLDVLVNAGFDVVAVANNHSMDYGSDAIVEQLDILASCGIAAAGAGKNFQESARPAYVQVEDVVVAFIGMENHFPLFSAGADKPGNFFAEGTARIKKALAPVIAEARKHAHLVVFTPHWGPNWTDNATPRRVELAHWIIDQGVDAILGHSSHHIHGIEIYRGHPVIYDMGSFLFDRVAQHRMRYSAAFVLEFTRSGFIALRIHPVRLLTNRTVLARQSDVTIIHDLVRRLTGELQEGLSFQEEGDVLQLRFQKQTPDPADITPPAHVVVAGSTSPVPDRYRNRPTNVVVDTPPEWANGFAPARFANQVRVIGATNVEAVWPGSAFVAQVLLEPPGQLKGAWVGIIRAINRDTGKEFLYVHPFADAGWDSNLWQPGQLFIDRTLVRPDEQETGKYDLYYGISAFRPESGRPYSPVPLIEAADRKDNFVHIGEILITTDGIPRGPSGVSWPGLLPGSKQFNQEDFDRAMAKEGLQIPMIAWFLPIPLIFIIAGVLFLIRKKRKRNS